MGDFPIMTGRGTFIINGTERVVVSQLVRSPGTYFSKDLDKTSDKDVYVAKIIPGRGAWLEFDVDKKDTVGVRIDRKRRQNVTVLLKALGWTSDEILTLFDNAPSIQLTLEKDHVETQEEALEDIYRKLRPGEPPTAESARTLLENLFFNPKRYDLARVGRHKVDKKLGGADGDLLKQLRQHSKALGELDNPDKKAWEQVRYRVFAELQKDETGAGSPKYKAVLTYEDILKTVRYLVRLHAGQDGLRPRRHRPLRQPPPPQRRRADPEPDPDRPVAHGARRQGADDDAGRRGDHAADADQHPSGRRLDQGVLRDVAAVAVHGPDEHALRAHAQAPSLGPRAGRTVARAGRVRGPGRPPVALRAHVPHRDARGAEHRPDRVALVVRAHQRVRVHRDPVPARHRRQGDRQDRLPVGRRGGQARHRPGERRGRQDGQVHRVARPRPQEGRRGRLRAARRGRLHGRVAEAARVGGGRVDPVPGARRREPRPDGREHAEAGRAPAPLRRPARRDRRGVPRGGRRRRRGHRAGRRHGRGRLGRRDRRQGAHGHAAHLQAAQVPAFEPGHVPEPEADRRGRRQGREGPGHRRRPVHRGRRGRAGQEPGRGVHAVGGPQLRGRDHPVGAPGQAGRPDLDPHRGARGRRPRHQARRRGDHPRHPERLRGDPEGPRRARDRPHRRGGDHRRLPGRQGHAQG